MRIGTRYCEPISDVRQNGNRVFYRNHKGQYIGDLSNVLKNPKLTDKKIGDGTHIFELAQ